MVSRSVATWPSPLLGVRFHDQHHEMHIYNYGSQTSLWDRACGTIHPRYDSDFA
jgi:sterol desaturase/sphingolipid hydroxylase (fatty acid hydroxylase superfamily)